MSVDSARVEADQGATWQVMLAAHAPLANGPSEKQF